MCAVMKMHPSVKRLADEIAGFTERHQLTATDFGLLSLNDGKFVGDLRRGRIPSLTTIDGGRAFMEKRDRVPA